MSSIERIEVIPGGGAVLYGSGTVGGIVNIITKNEQGTRGSADYRYGDTSGDLVNVNAGHTIGKFDFDLTYSNENGKGYREYEEQDIDSFVGKVKYNIDDNQSLLLKYSNIKDDSRYTDSLTLEEVMADREQSGLGAEEGNLYTTKTEEYSLNYINKLTDDFEFDILAYTKETDITNRSWEPEYEARPGVMRGGYDEETSRGKKHGVKAKGKYSYGEASSFIFGLEYKKDTLEQPTVSTTSSGYDLEQESFAIFALNNYKVNNFDFIQGVRYEKADYSANRYYILADGSINPDKNYLVEPTHDEFAYELAANYLYSDTGNAYIKYEKSFLLPPVKTLLSRERIYDADGKFESGDYYPSDISPENSDTFEIGIRDYIWNSAISAVVYYTTTKDEITGEAPFDKYFQPAPLYYNLGKTVRAGVDLSAEQSFDKLTISESYSYTNAEIKKGQFISINLDNTKMSYVPEHKFSLGASYEITDKILLMGDITYTSGIYVGNGGVSGYSLGKVNSHTVANIRMSMEATEGLNLYVGINNLFDKKYYESVGNDYGKFSYDPAAERNYYAGFSYSF